MKILEINFSDLIGHIFNGYDLLLALHKRGIEASQIVLDKRSNCNRVKNLSKDPVLHSQIREFEKLYSISNLLFPYGEEIINSSEFQTADLVHYHILHNGMVSLLDYPRLMNGKKSVWTIHDPWVITGNCVHPLACKGWKEGCGNCRRTDEIYFEMCRDNTDFMWKLKKSIFSQLNPHIIVASRFMEKYLKESPITCHFSKIHVIPFGIKAEKYFDIGKKRKLQEESLADRRIVIGFRADRAEIKGCRYIYEALRKLNSGDRIELLCVGNGSLPEDIRTHYHVTELGWTDDESEIISFFQTCDIFLMPSLAESFGLMAVEAMAAETPVVCFKGTTVEEIIGGTICGLSVDYRSSDALAEAVRFLTANQKARVKMGKQGRRRVYKHYLFEDYVYKHEKLYHEILESSLS